MANLATNFQDLVAKVKNLGALAPVLGAISRPDMVEWPKRPNNGLTFVFVVVTGNEHGEGSA